MTKQVFYDLFSNLMVTSACSQKLIFIKPCHFSCCCVSNIELDFNKCAVNWEKMQFSS